jgi:hypothetical protein
MRFAPILCQLAIPDTTIGGFYAGTAPYLGRRCCVDALGLDA